MKESIRQAKASDVHAHSVLSESMHSAGAYGPEMGHNADGQPWIRIGDYVLQGVRYENSAFMDMDMRLKAMDKAGIDFQVLSPNPLTSFHFIESPQPINFCQLHNDEL